MCVCLHKSGNMEFFEMEKDKKKFINYRKKAVKSDVVMKYNWKEFFCLLV